MSLALANRPRLIEPGLPRFEAGTERYRVAGGGALVVGLAAGDRFILTDPEGGQRAEVAAFSLHGQEDAAALGLSATGRAIGINRLLAGEDEAAKAVAAALKARGLPGRIDKAADHLPARFPGGREHQPDRRAGLHRDRTCRRRADGSER